MLELLTIEYGRKDTSKRHLQLLNEAHKDRVGNQRAAVGKSESLPFFFHQPFLNPVADLGIELKRVLFKTAGKFID